MNNLKLGLIWDRILKTLSSGKARAILLRLGLVMLVVLLLLIRTLF